MLFELKTEFETVEEAIAYLQADITTEISRLEAVENEEKPALLSKRDELLKEAKEAKAKVTEMENQVQALTTQKSDLENRLKGHATAEDELEAKYRRRYEEDKADFQKQLDDMKAEREREKQEAAAAELKADAIAELSKPNYRIANADHFYRLHGDRLTKDPDTGELFVDLGDYKRQSVAQFIEDIEGRPEEQHLFKPKGGSGSGSQGSGNNVPTTTLENPFKTGNITEQSRLFKTNRAMYDRLKAEAS